MPLQSSAHSPLKMFTLLLEIGHLLLIVDLKMVEAKIFNQDNFKHVTITLPNRALQELEFTKKDICFFHQSKAHIWLLMRMCFKGVA